MTVHASVRAALRPSRPSRATVAAAALACLPVVLLASSSVPGTATAPVATLSAPARPALGLQATTTPEPVPSKPVAPALGEALQEQARQASDAPTPQTAARVVPTQLLASGIPGEASAAYVRASDLLSKRSPGCHLSWPILAGIGRVESNHGRFGGSVLGADGVPVPPIVGPRLDGAGEFAAVADTDQGRLDGDAEFDRAVGPMQFIPSSWARVAIDADGDGVANPQDIDDAAAAAGIYLCAGGRDLRTGSGLGAAIYSYNHSADYVALVAAVAQAYAAGRAAPIADPVTPTASPTPSAASTPAARP